MVDLCGTRLRLLDQPLLEGAARCSYAEFVRSAEALGSAAFASVFNGLSLADAAALGRLLDNVEARAAAEEGAGGRNARAAWFGTATWTLTAGLRLIDLAPILFLDLVYQHSFQSLLHRRMWARLRSQYVAPAIAG